MIIEYLEAKGWRINYTSRCGMDTALIQFTTACSRDSAINNSPYEIGDSVLRITRRDRSLNYRSITFTHDVWLMLMNYPLECWEVGVVSRTVSQYGRFLIWNNDPRDKTRIIVKVRVMNVDTLPVSIVVLRNLDDVGYGDSWTCPTYILSREFIGQLGGDEDPLPPDGGNPHPLPHVQEGFWHDEVLGNIPMEQVVINPHNEHLGAPYEDVYALAAAGNANNNLNEVLPTTVMPSPMQEDSTAQVLNEVMQEDQMDFIPVPADGSQDIQASSPVFVPANASMEYEDAHNTGNMEQNNCVSDDISALQGLIGNIVSNAHDILPKLGGSKIVNAKCNIVDVEGTQGFSKKCYLQIMTVQNQPAPVSSASLTEITEEAFAEVCKPSGNNKRKKKVIVDEAFCRRSNRIA